MRSSPKADSPVFHDTVPVVEAAYQNTSREALEEAFGAERIVDNDDGSWDLKLSGKREIQKFDEMDRPRKRADVARGVKAAERDSATHVTVRDGRGRKTQVPERHAEFVDRINHHKRTGKW